MVSAAALPLPSYRAASMRKSLHNRVHLPEFLEVLARLYHLQDLVVLVDLAVLVDLLLPLDLEDRWDLHHLEDPEALLVPHHPVDPERRWDLALLVRQQDLADRVIPSLLFVPEDRADLQDL